MNGGNETIQGRVKEQRGVWILNGVSAQNKVDSEDRENVEGKKNRNRVNKV